jgi:tight adherence protein C
MELILTETSTIIPMLIFMAVIFMGSAVISGTMAYRNVIKERLDTEPTKLAESDAFRDKRRSASGEFVSRIGGAVTGEEAESSELRKKLTAAGFSGQGSVTGFLGVKMILLASTLVATAFVYVMWETTFVNKAFVILVLIAVGFFSPNVFVEHLAKKRAKIFRNHFPDAIDLLEICVSGGMGIDAAWNAVSENMRPLCGLLADELSLTNLEIHLGSTRATAMRNMAERTSSDDVASLVTSMVQSEKFGTSVGETLRAFALSLRTERSQKAEESAEKMAVKMLFPMVCFIFPVVLIVAVGPAAITMVEIFS